MAHLEAHQYLIIILRSLEHSKYLLRARYLVFISTGYKVFFSSLNFALINPGTTL